MPSAVPSDGGGSLTASRTPSHTAAGDRLTTKPLPVIDWSTQPPGLLVAVRFTVDAALAAPGSPPRPVGSGHLGGQNPAQAAFKASRISLPLAFPKLGATMRRKGASHGRISLTDLPPLEEGSEVRACGACLPGCLPGWVGMAGWQREGQGMP